MYWETGMLVVRMMINDDDDDDDDASYRYSSMHGDSRRAHQYSIV
jgi:hypothetical protein